MSLVAAEQESADVVLFTAPGSQFGAKVLVALDALGVEYRIVFVDVLKMKDQLVSPHTMPQMWWGPSKVLLTDSADCFKHLDACSLPWPLYPEDKKDQVEELEQLAGKELNAHVLYFTFWSDYGWSVSYGRKIEADLPCWACPGLFLWMMDTGRLRGSYRKKARNVLGNELIPDGREASPTEEAAMKASLVKLISRFDSSLLTDEQEWLCDTTHPSAADFALYGIIERLVGEEGDADMGTATPWLWEEAGTSRLQAWHERMVAKFPIIFKGKRTIQRKS